MAYIFLDESGDLGFDFTKARTSNFFLITFLFTKEKRPIEKVVRKTHADLRHRYKKISSVLHAAGEEPITRRRLLNELAKKDCSVMVIVLHKRRVHTKLQNEKAVLYNYVANILLDRLMTKKIISVEGPIFLIAAKRETNKFLNENFRDYLRRQTKDQHNLDLRVEIKTPAEEKALQAVDFASWAMFRKYESGDLTYYEIFKKKVIEESALFPG